MKNFLDDDFLLESKTAQKLYHDYARSMPIIDYHCHLPPDQIAEDRQFENLTQYSGGFGFKQKIVINEGFLSRRIY